MSDSEAAKRFLKNINENNDKKEYLSKLYNLSEFRKTSICAANQEKLNKIINQLNEKGYVLNE